MSNQESEWRDSAAAAAVRILVDLMPRLNRTVMNAIEQDGETGVLPARTLYRLLGIVAGNPGISLTELASRLGITKTNASPMLEKLVKEGLVARSPSPVDRRLQLLSLTPRGRAVFEQGWAKLTASFRGQLDSLEPAEGQALAEALRVLTRTLPRLL